MAQTRVGVIRKDDPGKYSLKSLLFANHYVRPSLSLCTPSAGRLSKSGRRPLFTGGGHRCHCAFSVTQNPLLGTFPIEMTPQDSQTVQRRSQQHCL